MFFIQEAVGVTNPLDALKSIYRLLSAVRQFNGNLYRYLKGFNRYLFTYVLFCRAVEINRKFEESFKYVYPCLNDWTVYTPVEPTYFHQDTWAAGKIFQNKPEHHYDVGSSVMTMGILSQFVPTTIVDIRPIDLSIPSLHFQKGSILSLPFEDESIESLSSLCVIEHIGLGRYGDEIDSFGSEKAADELTRVVKAGGNLFVSVPVDEECRVYFNAHRAFTRDYVLELFKCFELVEEKYIYGKETFDTYCVEKGFGTGLYYFKKLDCSKIT